MGRGGLEGGQEERCIVPGLGCWDILAGLAEDRKQMTKEKGPSSLGDRGQRPETGHMPQWDRKGLSPFWLHLMGEPLDLPPPPQGKGKQESPTLQWGVGPAGVGVGCRKAGVSGALLPPATEEWGGGGTQRPLGLGLSPLPTLFLGNRFS